MEKNLIIEKVAKKANAFPDIRTAFVYCWLDNKNLHATSTGRQKIHKGYSAKRFI
jgi:hypothetical protein